MVWQMVVPKGYSQGVLQLAHEHSQSDHLEVKKTRPHPPSLAECWEQFFWLGLKTDVAKPVALVKLLVSVTTLCNLFLSFCSW